MQFAQVVRAPDQRFDGCAPHDQTARSVYLHHCWVAVDLRIGVVVADRFDDGARVVVGLERDEHGVSRRVVHTAFSAPLRPSLATRVSKAAAIWASAVSASRPNTAEA